MHAYSENFLTMFYSAVSQPCHLLPPQVQEMREVLNGEWVSFQQVLIDSDIMIKKHKEKFKSSSILSSEQLKRRTEDAVQEFNSTGHTLCLAFFLSLYLKTRGMLQVFGQAAVLQ